VASLRRLPLQLTAHLPALQEDSQPLTAARQVTDRPLPVVRDCTIVPQQWPQQRLVQQPPSASTASLGLEPAPIPRQTTKQHINALFREKRRQLEAQQAATAKAAAGATKAAPSRFQPSSQRKQQQQQQQPPQEQSAFAVKPLAKPVQQSPVPGEVLAVHAAAASEEVVTQQLSKHQLKVARQAKRRAARKPGKAGKPAGKDTASRYKTSSIVKALSPMTVSSTMCAGLDSSIHVVKNNRCHACLVVMNGKVAFDRLLGNNGPKRQGFHQALKAGASSLLMHVLLAVQVCRCSDSSKCWPGGEWYTSQPTGCTGI